MATPRKYPTLAEFEELKAAVQELAQSRRAERPSVWVDAEEIAERMGLSDAHGVPVAVGDEIAPVDGGEPHRVRTIAVSVAGRDGKATVTAATVHGQSVTAVDMRLPGHVVTKKATA